jgi:hypothetical protein
MSTLENQLLEAHDFCQKINGLQNLKLTQTKMGWEHGIASTAVNRFNLATAQTTLFDIA